MRCGRGFTLVELVLVLVLVGALAVVAVPRFSRTTFDLAAAAGELVAAIRHTQQLAMSHSGIDRDSDGNPDRYQIAITATGYTVSLVDLDSTSSVADPVTGAASYTESWSGMALSPAVTLAFDGRGRPASSIGWSGNGVTVTLTLAGESTSIDVERTTGYAR